MIAVVLRLNVLCDFFAFFAYRKAISINLPRELPFSSSRRVDFAQNEMLMITVVEFKDPKCCLAVHANTYFAAFSLKIWISKRHKTKLLELNCAINMQCVFNRTQTFVDLNYWCLSYGVIKIRIMQIHFEIKIREMVENTESINISIKLML